MANDSTHAEIASDLSLVLQRVDSAVFNYPRELKTVGALRKALADTISELREHAGEQ